MMSDSILLNQIGNLIDQKLDEKLAPIKKDIIKELKQVITDSQEDTIQVLSDLINTGYNLHEKRIKRVEDHLQLPQAQ